MNATLTRPTPNSNALALIDGKLYAPVTVPLEPEEAKHFAKGFAGCDFRLKRLSNGLVEIWRACSELKGGLAQDALKPFCTWGGSRGKRGKATL